MGSLLHMKTQISTCFWMYHLARQKLQSLATATHAREDQRLVLLLATEHVQKANACVPQAMFCAEIEPFSPTACHESQQFWNKTVVRRAGVELVEGARSFDRAERNNASTVGKVPECAKELGATRIRS